MDDLKAADAELKSNVRRIDDVLNRQDLKVDMLESHCKALDNYLDKFQPLRMQAMISDHLSACLHSETRRKHKVYEDKKTALLMKLVLEDSGNTLRIQELIAEVTKMARITVEA